MLSKKDIIIERALEKPQLKIKQQSTKFKVCKELNKCRAERYYQNALKKDICKLSLLGKTHAYLDTRDANLHKVSLLALQHLLEEIGYKVKRERVWVCGTDYTPGYNDEIFWIYWDDTII